MLDAGSVGEFAVRVFTVLRIRRVLDQEMPCDRTWEHMAAWL
jgi:hypothetical protein